MYLNPILRRLGFRSHDRVVLLHADDLGMCQASVDAFAELSAFGLVWSGSAMVPCPAFGRLAAYCRAKPDVDMGVHLTLTSEHLSYRWSPVSCPAPASGLVDDGGYFPRSEAVIQRQADLASIETELKAQMSCARQAGIEVTHLDLHMGCLMAPALLPLYLGLSIDSQLPACVWRPSDWLLWGFDPNQEKAAVQHIADYQDRGGVVFDHLAEIPLDRPDNRLDQVKTCCDALEPGLTLLYIHPAIDTPELRTITPDWPSRVADYRVFTSPAMRSYLRRSGIQLVNYRQLGEVVWQQ